jgi:hypothetical protein
LGFHHRHFETSGLTLTVRWDSLLLGPSSRVEWSGGWVRRTLNLYDAATSNNVVPGWTQFLHFERRLSWGLCCRASAACRGQSGQVGRVALRCRTNHGTGTSPWRRNNSSVQVTLHVFSFHKASQYIP